MRMFSFFMKSLLPNIYFYTAILCVIFFSIESFSLFYMLGAVNPLVSLGFLSAWFSYYFIYFLPLGIIISSLTFFYKLFSQKKIQAFYIFGVSPKHILKQILWVTLIPISIGILFSFFITNADITYAKNYLMEEFAKKAIESIPPKTFQVLENYAIYFDNKTSNTFQNMFIYHENKYIYLKSAKYKNGVLYAKNGEILSKENGKNYIVSFKNFQIQIYRYYKSKLSKTKIQKGIILNITNIILTPFFVILGFFAISRFNMNSNTFYMFLAFFVIIHEAIITFIKTFILKA